jgi:EpsI family protein
MSAAIRSSIMLSLLMMASSVLAWRIIPTHLMANARPAIRLESALPVRFGDWKEEKAALATLVNPELDAALRQIYTQTLSRTYVNSTGYRIMLSLAYGANQSDGLQWHYPETCYPAQGFEVTSRRDGWLTTSQGSIPVKRMETNLARQRFEPVTYWAIIGDVVVVGAIDKKLTEMRYRIGGQIPDGLLFRISSIDTDSERSFLQQNAFVNDLVRTLPPLEKRRLTGLPR